MVARIKKVMIEEIPVKGKPLGRHIEHDPRSRAFAAVPKKTVTIKSIKHTLYGSILNQGNLGSCTGNATCGALNTKGLHKSGSKIYKESDAIDVYSLATSLDEFQGQYPPDDTGSSGLSVAKAAQQKGWITEYRHAFNSADALGCLMERAFIMGINWYEGFDKPDSNGVVTIQGQVRGGHEICVNGYELSAGMFQCINSWGRSFGLNGRFYMSLATLDQLLGEDGDCTILII